MRLEFDKLSMQTLADTLTPFLDRPVMDETALKGNFKVGLDLPMEAMLGMMQNMARTSGMAGGFGGGGRGGPGGGPGGRGFGDGPAGGGLAGCAEQAAIHPTSRFFRPCSNWVSSSNRARRRLKPSWWIVWKRRPPITDRYLNWLGDIGN
jgi:hypothetical protein